MHIVVCYDVRDDLKRARLHRFLRNFLTHVQRSVFEGDLAEARIVRMREGIPGIVDGETDTVRIYALCERDVPRTEIIGTGIFVDTDDDDVVV